MSGLTPDGLVIETTQEIRDGMNTRFKEKFGPGIDTSDGTIEGQTFGLVADRLGDCWLLLQALYSSLDPDGASGIRLHAIGAYTGTVPRAAKASSTVLTLTGVPATVVNLGNRASIEETEDEFATDAGATIVALTAWAGATNYVVGDRRTNNSKTYICTDAGTSAASGGPTTEDDAIVDNGVIWRWMGNGTGAVDVAATAVETGPIVANSGAIRTIETPVTGWLGVVNLEDADVGNDLETDEDFRIRREQELAGPGTAPLDAIRADLLKVPGVTSTTIFHNVEDFTDADGVPPHAIEALVTGGDDQDIWDQLRKSVAAGIKTYGDEIGTSTDDAGNIWDEAFSRPEDVDIYVIITILKDPRVFPLDGSDQIKQKIVDYGDAQPPGYNAVSAAIAAQALPVAGVLDMRPCYIGTAPAPATETTIQISNRQQAKYDTSRITVILVDGTP